MRVFVAGASGVLGRAAIPPLIAAGHQVVGLAHRPESRETVERLGAQPTAGDILDAGGLARLLAEHRPEVVINLATSIPHRLKIDPADWVSNDRIRTDGARALIRASEAAGVGLLVQESVGYVCRSHGAEWIDEGSPRSTHPFLRATVEMEEIVRSARVPGVLLRFAALMSPDAWHTRQSVAALRRGVLPIIGGGDNFVSTIHAEDAAAAIAGVVAHRDTAAGKTYNVADDEPAPMAEIFGFAARVLRGPRPRSVPALLAKMAAGSVTIDVLAASYRMSNARIRADCGFAPRFPTYRETWLQIAAALGETPISLSSDLA
jgi:nucleoside-diphosphate-sugar epimerase